MKILLLLVASLVLAGCRHEPTISIDISELVVAPSPSPGFVIPQVWVGVPTPSQAAESSFFDQMENELDAEFESLDAPNESFGF